MIEKKLSDLVIHDIDSKATYDALVTRGAIGNEDLCLVEEEKDVSLGLTGASIGQIAKVKTINDNGVPIEWIASNSADDKWELLVDVTLEEAASSYSHEFSTPQRKILVILETPVADANTTHSGFVVSFNNEAGTGYKPESGTIYPYPVPRTSAIVSYYMIETYYVGGVPLVIIHMPVDDPNKIVSRYLNSLQERYYQKMMVPEIIRFGQNSYGTFPAGTRYRIFGVEA